MLASPDIQVNALMSLFIAYYYDLCTSSTDILMGFERVYKETNLVWK